MHLDQRVRSKKDAAEAVPGQHGDILYQIYYDCTRSPACFSSFNNVLAEAEKYGISKEEVRDFLEEQEPYTLHRARVRRFPRRRIVTAWMDYDWQADLLDFKHLRKHNDNHPSALICIDVLSKYGWCQPLKNKKPQTVYVALEKIMQESGRRPVRICTDRGLEFSPSFFTKPLDENYQIRHFYAPNSDVKAAVVERYARTVKERLWKYFTKTGSLRWLEALPKIVDAVNHTVTRTHGLRPIDVNQENEGLVWIKLYGKELKKRKLGLNQRPFKFDVGDQVRIAIQKKTLEKGYMPNFTLEIFEVTERRGGPQPHLYLVKSSEDGEQIEGTFYEQELVRVQPPPLAGEIDRFLETKVKDNELWHKVKWKKKSKGTSWISDRDLVVDAHIKNDSTREPQKT
jgi:hypothetical protein